MCRLTFILLITFCLLVPACSPKPTEKILFDFEADEELDQFRWKCHTLLALSDEHAIHGSKSLRLELYPSEYPGLAPQIKDNNWSQYETFQFDVYSPHGEDIPLTVRIDDKKDDPDYADRYNRSFVIKPGANTVSISFDSLLTSGTRRPLNLTNIDRLLIFVVQPSEKVILYCDYIRLTK